MFVRELLPQDLKLELDQLNEGEAIRAAGYLAQVVGQAHARQMDADTRKRWRAELQRDRSRSFDAPSWLWTSVVQLVGSHEQGYLEHCRRFAMADPGVAVLWHGVARPGGAAASLAARAS